MSSTKSLVIYHERIEINNNLEGNIKIESIDNPQLSYVILKEQVNQASTVADSNNNMKDQHVLIKDPALNSSGIPSPSCVDNDNIINVQLLYDPNRLIELELWDSNFHSVLLYGLLKYLTSNANSIRKSMTYMSIYIKNKKN